MKIVIVGGGTAGWMAANLFATKWRNKANITLIESPSIATIGVGEGSTPYLKRFFKQLGIDENEWMPKCNATYKNGILFSHWSTVPGYQQYFHPFHSDFDKENLTAFEHSTILRRNGYNIHAHPDNFFVVTELTKQFKISKLQKQSTATNLYGYHFDSSLLAQMLKKNAQSFGVRHISSHVQKVKTDLAGDIEKLDLDDQQTIEGDIFIDCTGFKSLLINKTLGVPFHSYSKELLNDSAIALPSKRNSKEMSQTVSTAFSNGWAWRIPLRNRIGNGYVYSSSHQSAESAEQELRAKLAGKVHDVEAKHLKMRIGRLTQHWYKNCLAVGLSQGFVEPLEATGLHLIQNTIEQFIHYFEKGNFTNQYQSFYNEQTNFGFDRIKDYVLLHYLSNSRHDSQYWKDARNIQNISESLQRIMHTWISGEDLRAELENQSITNYYSSMSWHAMLAGVGVYANKLDKQVSAKLNSEITQINKINKQYCHLFQNI
ncbi:tryptophan halogenase family protein [Thalassotalea agariperforans]